ncbi:hypothetical protein BT93_B0822 [Corymbia citriodora subsp. variegata]|nr:hypothetical protein BT93_B0822 [Corymbia citriodora subsp. variegata]
MSNGVDQHLVAHRTGLFYLLIWQRPSPGESQNARKASSFDSVPTPFAALQTETKFKLRADWSTKRREDSDVRGGQRAVGEARQGPTGGVGVGGRGEGNYGGHEDAVDLSFRVRGQPALFSQIELSLSASKLRDHDVMSKGDPVAVVYLRKRNGMLEELGRTKVILNSLDPAWIEKISLAYHFLRLFSIWFHVYDVETKYHNVPVKTLKLKDQEFLGEASCVLLEIVTKPSRSLTLLLHNKNLQVGSRNLGTLTVHAEESVATRTADPFLRISSVVESGGSLPICKTEVINNNLNPSWTPLCLSMQQFRSKENPLVIECFDFDTSGNHALIGKLQKSVADLEKLHKERNGENFTLPASHHDHEKVFKSQLFVDQFCEKRQYSFLDYISSSFELTFMVALQVEIPEIQIPCFTLILQEDTIPTSRYILICLLNLVTSLMEFGVEIQFYDLDRWFTAWGFGGRSSRSRRHHGCLCDALHNVSLDGVLTNQQETMDALVRASDLPLLDLIGGVGGADFTQIAIDVFSVV